MKKIAYILIILFFFNQKALPTLHAKDCLRPNSLKISNPDLIEDQSSVRVVQAVMYGIHEFNNKIGPLITYLDIVGGSLTQEHLNRGYDDVNEAKAECYRHLAELKEISLMFERLHPEVHNTIDSKKTARKRKKPKPSKINLPEEIKNFIYAVGVLETQRNKLARMLDHSWDTFKVIDNIYQETTNILVLYTEYIKTGRMELQLDEVDLNLFFKNFTQNEGRYSYAIKRKYTPCFRLKRVLVDTRLLNLMARNFLKNANEACCKSLDGKNIESKDAVFLVKTELKESYVEIIFADNGPGIAAGDLANIFDLNFTKGKAYGSGIGLAVVLEQVRLLAGEIEVVSRQKDRGAYKAYREFGVFRTEQTDSRNLFFEKGTTFIIKLPYVTDLNHYIRIVPTAVLDTNQKIISRISQGA